MKTKKDGIFHKFGPALLAIALGIGSGEFILWPFMTVHYGLGILWGALLGIAVQVFLINAIQKHSFVFQENIVKIFEKVFPYAFWWVVVSTILGFGWPAFAATASSLFTNGFEIAQSWTLYISVGLILLSGTILILAPNAYKQLLNFQKINMIFLLMLSFFLFFYYFDIKIFLEMMAGFFGYSKDYWFVPAGISISTFLAAIAYAGSGGNLLLANSFYALEENKKKSTSDKDFWGKYNRVCQQNLVFFMGGGLLIIVLLAYIAYVALQGSVLGTEHDFMFLIEEAKVFSADLHPLVGKLFLLSGILALFGVQMGIFDFVGRISNKYYKHSVLAITIFGAVILLLGFQKPKLLLVIGAVINAFSMGIIALLLWQVERKIIDVKYRTKKNLYLLPLATLFYFAFFGYVVVSKIM